MDQALKDTSLGCGSSGPHPTLSLPTLARCPPPLTCCPVSGPTGSPKPRTKHLILA